MKTFRVKAFYGDVRAEDCPEIEVVARDESSAYFKAMLDIVFRNFASLHHSYFEFIEAVKI